MMGYSRGRSHHWSFALLIILLVIKKVSLWKSLEEAKCPSVMNVFHCSCSLEKEGLFFICDGSDLHEVRNVLAATKTTEAIRSFTILNLDKNISVLGENVLADAVISELRIKRCSIKELEENVFLNTGNRLHTLSVKDCALEAVPRAVTKVSSLMRLELEGNQISVVYPFTFFGPSKLSHLNLKNNRLDSLAENGLIGLENTLRELNLRDNLFESFPMSAIQILKKLQSLDLGKNKLRNISFDGYINRLDSLLYLDLSFNEFRELGTRSFSSMPNIKRLRSSHNRISKIQPDTFFSQSNLAELDLSYNVLTELPADVFRRCHRLVTVDLSHNRLTQLSCVFKDLIALEKILLNDNLLLSFADDWFNNSPNLKTIHLERNVIFEIQLSALQPLKRLSELYLSYNFLSTITVTDFRYNVALTSLSLDNNHISTIESGSFRGVPRLRELRLQNNVLKEISRELFSSLAQLSELHLQDNKIFKIEPQAFSGLALLQYLDLRGNRLPKMEDIMMRYPSTLRSMYLDRNRISTFHKETFSGQTTVEVLSISFNRLETITSKMFEELINLFRLSLSDNRILNIEDHALSGLHQVRVLDLSNNRLSKLTNATLKGLQQAEKLDLFNNRISFIANEAFSGFHHLKELDLSGNRIRYIRNGAFRGCLTLHTLKLNNAGVRFIAPNALDDFKKLSTFELKNNQLSIPEALYRLSPPSASSTLSSLKTLILSFNDLSNASRSKDATLEGLQNIESIELEGCNLTIFRSEFLWKNTKLKIIKLGQNNLNSLSDGIFSKHVFLEELHLDQNTFSSVPRNATRYLYNLKIFNLSGNILANNLDESSFDNVAGLQALDLSSNGIRSVPERTFHNVTRLKELNISNNSFSGFESRTFVPLTELSSLKSRDNRLPFIPVAVQGLRSIRLLDLSLNQIRRLKEIPESRAIMLSVKKVLISMTNLSTLEPDDLGLFPKIEELDMSRNKLSRIAPYSFTKQAFLEKLDLSQNEIFQYSREIFQGLVALKTLNLSSNHLTSLGEFPKDAKSIKILDVSFNRLTSLSQNPLNPKTFLYLDCLVRLDLRGNRLMTIDAPLIPLINIRALDLSENLFTDVPLNEIKPLENSIERLDFDNNPFVCSCHAYTQKIWLRQHRKWLQVDRRGSKVGPTCAEPAHLRERYLLTIKDSELCPLPSVESLRIEELLPHSLLLRWESLDTNMTGLKGFIVAYHRLDRNDRVRKYRVGPEIRGFRVTSLEDNTLYLICVITRGSSYASSVLNHDENEEEEEDNYVIDEDEIVRFKRSKDSIFGENVFGTVFPSFFSSYNTNEELDTRNISDNFTVTYPSSNDTDLFIFKPTVLNLGSESSKCTEIRTHLDPAKMSLIDNKRLSIIIGVISGLVVFAVIIILIIVKPKKKNDDDIAITDSASGSYKSPVSTKRSVEISGKVGGPHSRTNSQSSFVILPNNKGAGEVQRGVESSGGTLPRRRNHQQTSPRVSSKQESVESFPSRPDFFEKDQNYRRKEGSDDPLSWQGTPSKLHNGRPKPAATMNSDGYPTFPRRNADRLQFQEPPSLPHTGSNSLEGLVPPSSVKRRSEPLAGLPSSSIPLIEYHLVEDDKDRNSILLHHHHHHHLHHFPPKRPFVGTRPHWNNNSRFKSNAIRHPSEDTLRFSSEDYLSDPASNKTPPRRPFKPAASGAPPPAAMNKAFIKYNSFANY